MPLLRGKKSKKKSDEEIFATARDLLKKVTRSRGSKIAQKMARPSDRLDQEVRELYTDPDGTMPDLSKLDRVRSNRSRNVFFAVTGFLALLAGVAWAGFFVFRPYAALSEDDLSLRFEAPETVRSGETVTILLRYGTGKHTAIENMELSLKLPESFVMTSAEPAPTEGVRWAIGPLPKGEKREIKIVGVPNGATGTLIDLQAFASYTPVDFSSPFQTVATAAIPISGSTLELKANATERALPGEPVSVTFAYKNNGELPFQNGALRVLLPQGFVMASSTPAPAGGPTSWSLGTIAPGGTGEVTLKGTFASEAKGSLVFAGDFGNKKGSDFFTQVSAEGAVSVIGGDLVLTAIVNGGTEGKPVNFGDTLHTTFSYANRSEATLGDVELVLHVDARPEKNGASVIDLEAVAESSKGVLGKKAIRWTKKEIPALAKLDPGEEGSIELTLELAEKPFIPGVKDYALDLWVEGAVGTLNGAKSGRVVQSPKFHFPFLSDLALSAESRYYNDDDVAVGTGPLPPRAGKETTYRIFWKIKNGLHELRDLTLQTTLPDNVRFTGKKDISAGELVYDEEKRSVVWKLNKFPLGAPEIAIDFEVGLTPGNAAVGNILPLTGDISLDAEDASLLARILRTASAVDTTLANDPLGEGKGTVRAAN